MAWTVEVSRAAVADQRAIFRHLFDAHHNAFGHSTREARELAVARVRAIRDDVMRLGETPRIGASHVIAGRAFRHLTIDRAIFWFRLDEARETVVVEGVFFGGQDHLGYMMRRLGGEGG